DFKTTFDYLAFHTPFAGMVKGAHRTMMRRFTRSMSEEIDADFERRVSPSLRYCVEVGNLYSGSLYLALCGVVAHRDHEAERRVGMYSYGSGCSSEFFSGVISEGARQRLGEMR